MPSGYPTSPEERNITELSIVLDQPARRTAALPAGRTAPRAAPIAPSHETKAPAAAIEAPREAEPQAAAAEVVSEPVMSANRVEDKRDAPAAARPAAGPSQEAISDVLGPGTPESAAAVAAADSAAGESAAGAAPSPSTLALLNAAIRRSLKYPPLAKKRGIEGRVEMEIAVDEIGALVACEVVGPSGSGILDEAALKLLRGLFPLNGRGDGFRTRIAIDYRLN